MTVFLVVLGLAMGALLLMRAAALFVRPERAEAIVAEGACAPCAAPRHPRQISRSAVRRSFFHALRAPGPLCERALSAIGHGVFARGAVLRRFASAPPPDGARLPARAVPAPG